MDNKTNKCNTIHKTIYIMERAYAKKKDESKKGKMERKLHMNRRIKHRKDILACGRSPQHSPGRGWLPAHTSAPPPPPPPPSPPARCCRCTQEGLCRAEQDKGVRRHHRTVAWTEPNCCRYRVTGRASCNDASLHQMSTITFHHGLFHLS